MSTNRGQESADYASAPWSERETEAIVNAAAQAINRTRFVFMVITITGVLVAAATFNATVPWVRNTLQRANKEARILAQVAATTTGMGVSGSPSSPTAEDVAGAKFDAEESGAVASAMRDLQWRELHVVSVPVLGFKVVVTDMVVLGPLTFAVLCVWFYFCSRRESDVIQRARQAAKETPSRARWLYHGIIHHNVFTTTSTGSRSPSSGASKARWLLFYIPVWVSALAVLADILTVVLPRKIGIVPKQPLDKVIPRAELLELTIRWIFALACAAYCFRRLRECDKLDHDAKQALLELGALAGETHCEAVSIAGDPSGCVDAAQGS